jgi:hypothetical protein
MTDRHRLGSYNLRLEPGLFAAIVKAVARRKRRYPAEDKHQATVRQFVIDAVEELLDNETPGWRK